MLQTDGPDRGSPPSTPRWVKLLGSIVLILVLLVGILHLTGNSLGGPGSHTLPGGAGATPSGGPGGHTPPIEHGGQQP